MDPYYPHHSYNLKNNVASLSQWPPESSNHLWPEDVTTLGHLTRHALVMGNTWGLLIPLTILMASLRHKKKGWWFQLHRALAILSLILVIIGVILGRRLRISHPPVTFAGKCHKVMGYSALAFIVVQAVSTLLWRPLGNHSFRSSWNAMHQTWGMATMTVGFVAVNLGIWVAGVGWPYYLLFALEVTVILGFTSLQKPQQVASKAFTQQATTIGHTAKPSEESVAQNAGGIIPWLIKQQSNAKQA